MSEHPKKTGTKNDSSKPPLDLLPREALEEAAKAFGFGANKYGRYNYRGGINYSRLIAGALRHINQFNDGEDVDPESQCNHIGNAIAGLSMLLWMHKNRPDLDDRYKPKPEKLGLTGVSEYTHAVIQVDTGYNKFYIPYGYKLVKEEK